MNSRTLFLDRNILYPIDEALKVLQNLKYDIDEKRFKKALKDGILETEKFPRKGELVKGPSLMAFERMLAAEVEAERLERVQKDNRRKDAEIERRDRIESKRLQEMTAAQEHAELREQIIDNLIYERMGE